MKTEQRILFACFTGAAIGGVVALQLDLFWWIGILVGGATGYLAYGFREVLRAVIHAWRSLREGPRLRAGLGNIARFAGVLTCIVCCALAVFAISIGAMMSLMVAPVDPVTEEVAANPKLLPIPLWFWVACAAAVLIPLAIIIVAILRSANRKQTSLGVLGCIAATPLVLPVTLAVIFLWAIVPRGARLLVRLARQTFLLIHSELRLLCMTDALVGALVGFACGNALVGGLVGAALGWVNYRVISVRWLKLDAVKLRN